MRLKSLIKYAVRFIFLQILLSTFTIYYFNEYLIPKIDLFPDQKGYTFRDQINNNIYEDLSRFFPFLDDGLFNLNIFIFIFITIFLIFLYSTKFYTYVNELTFSLDRSYLDEYFSIYLTWTTSLMIFVTMFRLSNLISRYYLLIFTFLVPLILLVFRNSEFLSSLIGRSVTNETFISINLKDDSIFKKLRIMTFRKELDSYIVGLHEHKKIIEYIDKSNKKNNVNLIVIYLENINILNPLLEEYLINLNKKILLISKENIIFNSYFISRIDEVSGYQLTYFNNDIQYGSKYILKRSLDVLISLTAIILLLPIFLIISLYIYALDRGAPVLTQVRIGLHGQKFKMYKFRTMKKDSHTLREELREQSKNDPEIFKLQDDPRVLDGAKFLRKYSLDELPQLVNVLNGTMSIVGPRPLFEEDTLLFNKNYMRRLNVLPGITGLLQINERNTSDFSIWYKYDIEYIDNWSLYLDLKIILKTPYALIKGGSSGL